MTPDQELTKTDKFCSKERNFDTYQQAEEFYLTALQRLLNVGGRNALSGSPTGFYRLLNSQGEVKPGHAEEGDFIVQGNFTDQHVGDSYLHIEKKISKLHEHNRSMAFVTRPVQAIKSGPGLRYSAMAGDTLTLVLQLTENRVSMGVFEKDYENNVVRDEWFYRKAVR